MNKEFAFAPHEVREVQVERGVLTPRVVTTSNTIYQCTNVDGKAKTVWIEHPIETGFEVLNQKPVETTSTAYRFEVKLAAAGSEAFAISEERLDEESSNSRTWTIPRSQQSFGTSA